MTTAIQLPARDGIWIVGSFLLVLVAAALAFFLARRYFRSKGADSSPASAFTLDGLKKMHSQGLISDEEYLKLRDQVR